MNSIYFGKYINALIAQNKYQETIDTFYKMDTLSIEKTKSIYCNCLAAYAFLNNL